MKTYVTGILKVGHPTREMLISQNGEIQPIHSPQDMILFRQIPEGIFAGNLGLLSLLLEEEKGPEATMSDMLRELVCKKPELKYETYLYEAIKYDSGMTEYNLHLVFSARLDKIPQKDKTRIIPVKLGDFFDTQQQIYPAHYVLLEQLMLTKKNRPNKRPSKLEILVSFGGRRPKIRMLSTT